MAHDSPSPPLRGGNAFKRIRFEDITESTTESTTESEAESKAESKAEAEVEVEVLDLGNVLWEPPPMLDVVCIEYPGEISHEDIPTYTNYVPRAESSSNQDYITFPNTHSNIYEPPRGYEGYDFSGYYADSDDEFPLYLNPTLLTGPVVDTYEQALRYVDAEVQTKDDFIISLGTAKLRDGNHTHKDTLMKAMRIIAEYRNSDVLLTWCNTGGDFSAFDDPVTSAFQYFDIKERSGPIDLDSLRVLADYHCVERPHEADTIRKHLTVLEQYLSGQPQHVEQPNYEEPVGLANMGNTCYLNCLLQFFYAVKPLRTAVLDFDTFKASTDPATFVKKKVAGLDVTLPQAMKAQQCKKIESRHSRSY
jgi:hypothetical protein